MRKNILVLNGSPRKGGNSHMLADAFVKGAKGAGHEVVVFDTAAKIVQGCRACDACWSKGDACVFEDGFRELAPLLAKADVLVLCTPLYWFGVTAQIKAAIDKMYAFMVPACKEKLKFTECVLLMCAEDHRKEAFSGAVGTYREMCNYLEVRDRGTILVPGVNKAGEMTGNPALREAEALGASIA